MISFSTVAGAVVVFITSEVVTITFVVFLERQEKLLELLNEYGEEYDSLLNHTNRDVFITRIRNLWKHSKSKKSAFGIKVTV